MDVRAKEVGEQFVDASVLCDACESGEAVGSNNHVKVAEASGSSSVTDMLVAFVDDI